MSCCDDVDLDDDCMCCCDDVGLEQDDEYNKAYAVVYAMDTPAGQEMKRNKATRNTFDKYGGKGKHVEFKNFKAEVETRIIHYSKEFDTIFDNGLPQQELDLLCER